MWTNDEISNVGGAGSISVVGNADANAKGSARGNSSKSTRTSSAKENQPGSYRSRLRQLHNQLEATEKQISDLRNFNGESTGTSGGVDMNRGTPVRGGHRHHLRAINTIRRCGSIAAAVEQGVLTSGIFYECVRAGIPFSLAASIRDDGPLPGVFTDMIEAQRDYARLIAGAEMILMLSSMLHSIGVGNMTPAGVRLVCVDINPAVVTKLADRGSIESIGVVTDVGLFLSLLVQQVRAERGS